MKNLLIILFLMAGLQSTTVIAANSTNQKGYIWGGKSAQPIVVYSARKSHLIKPLFDAFTEQTGIKVKYLTGKSGSLIERLKLEGENTPADMLITVDAGNLWYAKTQDLFQAIHSTYLDSTLPSYLVDEDKTWFGLSVRARTLVYNTDKVSPAELSTYDDLAHKKWQGRLCLRSAKKIYNKSLVASMIHHNKIKKTQNTIQGWVDNLATKPFAKDSQVMKAIVTGQCDVGLVNTYYYGRFKKDQPNASLGLFWANQNTTGTHINISGAGILKHAPSPKLAQQLLEFLSSIKAQSIYAQLNQEYPANQNIAASDLVASWGKFKHDTMNLSQVGKKQAQAVKLMQTVGYK